MDNSVVTPNVDFSKIEAINQKRTLAFINHWVLHTVAFLNQFSALCEERLVSLSTKLRRADHTLAILEAKLKSVPWLEDVVAPSIDTTTTTTSTATVQSEPTTVTTQSVPNSATTTTTTTTEGQDVVDIAEEDTTTTTPAAPEPSNATPVSQDPRFVRYFRMLKMGVPDPAVRMRMSADGVDPSILNDPDAPAPPDDNSGQDDSDSSSVASWSE
ncbi:hypothetical protein Pmani_028510 [Petrolisthes manimaculis]|uniref:WASH complex subunit 3 n=1 Tax=Petrolisthes manimaculis TaxID=1843537 RepID=A0AAE1TVF1_9EUCA|nr:hypothetical protein Pmani_028510 [Petrolisthes manimaculis]